VDDRISAIIVGVPFSVANAVVTIYLGMKTGLAEGIVILLLFLSASVFTLARSLRPRTFVYLMAVVTSSTAAVIAYTDGMGAIILSGEALPAPDYAMMALLGVSGIIGMLMSFYFTDYFLKRDFPWPQSRVYASIIAMLSKERKDLQFKTSAVRMLTSGALAGAVSFAKGTGAIPEVIGLDVAGIGLSPMLIGIGMLIGFRACLQIAIGTSASLAIFLFLESPGTDYVTHMRSPWIFSTALSMMITTALITLYIILKPAAVKALRKTSSPLDQAVVRDGGTQVRQRSNGTTLLLAAIVTITAPVLEYLISIPAWIFLLCIPISVLFQVIESRGKAETGMSVGVSSFAVLLLIGLAFADIVPLLVLEGFVVAMILSFVLTLSTLKIAGYSDVSTAELPLPLAVGSITGGIICIPIIRILNVVYGIGTEALPAPWSVMWLEMARSAVTHTMSPSINLYLILAGIALALLLHRYKISAITVALGLILPFSVNATVFAGGAIAWYIGKKNWLKDDNGITASGLIAGDIIVEVATSLLSLL